MFKQANALRDAVSAKLRDLRSLAVEEAPVDSPLFQLLGEWKPGHLARDKTDIFRKEVQLNEKLKRRLAAIREKGKNKQSRAEASGELEIIRAELVPLDAVEAVTAIDLMLSFRALEDWDGMISVCRDMPEMLKRQILVREQLGFAYNRRAGKTKNPADRAEALAILTAVEDPPRRCTWERSSPRPTARRPSRCRAPRRPRAACRRARARRS